MALNIGELVGYIGLDSAGFEAGLDSAFSALTDGKWGTAAGAVGLAAGAALTAGLLGAVETDSTLRKMNAGLGLTGDAAQRAGQVAGNLYSNAYGESMEDVAAATSAVMSSIPGMMDAPAADLEGLTASVLDLATAFDVDVAEATQVAGAMMRDGLASDGTEAMDLLTASMQKVPMSVRGEILPIMSEYSKHFAALGLDGEAAMGLVVAASQDGAIGMDKMGDALKELTISLADEGKSEFFESLGLDQDALYAQFQQGGPAAQDAMGKITAALAGVKDPSAQAAAAIGLFGTPLEDLGTEQIPGFIDSLRGAEGGLGDVSGAAARMGEEINGGPAVALETFKRQAITSFTGIAAQAIPVLQPVVDFLGRWGNVIGPVVAVLGGLAAVVWVVSAAISAFTVIAGAAGAVIAVLTSPITLVIAAVAALVAALWLIVSNWEQISAWLGSAFAAFAAWWSTMWGGLVNGVSAAWQSIVSTVQTWWGGLINWLISAGAGVASWWSGLWTGVASAASALWAGIVAAVSAAWGGLITTLTALGAGVVSWWSGLWTGVAAAAGALWSLITGAVTNGFRLALAGLQAVGSTLSAWWSGLWSGVAALASSLWAGITSAVTGGFRAALAGLQAVGATLSAWWSGLWTGVASLASSLWAGITAAVTGGFRLALSGLQVIGGALSAWWSGMWGTVASVARSIWAGISGAVIGFFRNVYSGLMSIGSALSAWWSGLWSGVRNTASAIWQGIVSTVTGLFRSLYSGLMSIGSAIASWWSGLWSRVTSAASAAWRGILSTVTGLFRNVYTGLMGIGSALVSWWSSMWSGVRNTVSSVWEGIRSIISSAFSAVLGVIRDTGSQVVSTLAGAWSQATSGIRGFIDGALRFFRDLPGGITRALGNVGGLLLNAGRQIIDGFVRGLKDAWEAGKKFISGIGPWIADNKGPKAYDLALLVPAGRWIMSGLQTGLEKEVPALGNTLQGITEKIEGGLSPELDVSASLSASNRTAGLGPSAAELAYAVSAALPEWDMPRELILNLDGRPVRAYVEEVSADTTRRAAETLSAPLREFAGV